ncbi:uncharacterized protein YALI1_E36432g [Yarrowia lipolytica]|jgi:hypothetical protein|uniref:Uncharacterized protein n=1 Tax=Yarrowia lipolytica TaxID=4952 RepID=A0A1D8NKN9_YARLL|nr:hypothetical protein YALI1_E36432g [Yarrowia lipolytica]
MDTWRGGYNCPGGCEIHMEKDPGDVKDAGTSVSAMICVSPPSCNSRSISLLIAPLSLAPHGHPEVRIIMRQGNFESRIPSFRSGIGLLSSSTACTKPVPRVELGFCGRQKNGEYGEYGENEKVKNRVICAVFGCICRASLRKIRAICVQWPAFVGICEDYNCATTLF